MEDQPFALDLNDILNENLMPTSLFLHHHQHDEDKFVDGTNLTRKHFYKSVIKDGNMNDAIYTMGYHRQKMNEYLVTNFMAKQIVSDLSINPSRIQRRMGTILDDDSMDDVLVYYLANYFPADINENFEETTNRIEFPKKWNHPNDELLYDQGSVGYKDWLEKTTTLDDIHRQFGENLNEQMAINQTTPYINNKNIEKLVFTKRHGSDDSDYEEDEYEEGDVTGFAINKPASYTPLHQTLPVNTGPSATGTGYAGSLRNFGINPTAGSKTVKFSAIYHPPKIEYVTDTTKFKEGYFHPSAQESYDHEEYEASYPMQSTSSSLKEIGLKDIMDIALTTLAFLSFGMFILQVLMCITMNNNNNENNMMMMPMENPDETETVETVEEIRRKRRSIENDRIFKVNELSRRVLLSIDTVISTSEDDGKCLQKVLCENNKYGREQKDGQKIWIPVWSLGISWLSSRFGSLSSALHSLKATAIGLGGGNCSKIYSECDFNAMKS